MERRGERLERLLPLIEVVIRENNPDVREALVSVLRQEIEPDKEYVFVASALLSQHGLA